MCLVTIHEVITCASFVNWSLIVIYVIISFLTELSRIGMPCLHLSFLCQLSMHSRIDWTPIYRLKSTLNYDLDWFWFFFFWVYLCIGLRIFRYFGMSSFWIWYWIFLFLVFWEIFEDVWL